MGLRNPNHPSHDLKLKELPQPYTCNGCKEIGIGPRYHCARCDYNLHEACMFPKILPSPHEFFPKSMFKFFATPPRVIGWTKCGRICDGCMKPVKGFVYHSKRNDLDLHPCCRNLKKRYEIEDTVFNLHDKIRGQCMWCELAKSTKDSGWSYVSECGEYNLHVACVTEMALHKWHNSGGESVRVDKYTKTSHWLWRNKDHPAAIGARGHGGRVRKYWRIFRIIVKTIASIILGHPTAVIPFLELIAPSP